MRRVTAMLGRSTTRARCWRKGHRRLELSLDASGRWLGALPQPLTVALEATLYWHWLERELTALGIHVLVAHPNQVKLIWQARTKTGPIDARKLADLARG